MKNPDDRRQFYASADSLGQSFTAPSAAAYLTAISIAANADIDNASLYIYSSSNTDGYNYSPGTPDYIQTGISLTAFDSADYSSQLQRIELDTPFPIEAGEIYRFHIVLPDGGPLRLQMTNDDKYTGGTILTFFAPTTRPEIDLVFQAWGMKSHTIQFDNATPVEGSINGTLAPIATASSGLPVTISIADASANICSMAGGTVKFNAPGICLLHADQAGNEEYLPATQASHSITVRDSTLLNQTISFTTPPPSNAVVGNSYSPAATATSGLAVSFTIAPESTGVCSLSNSEVLFTALGICTVLANQAGDSTYLPADQIQQSFTVLTSPAPAPATGVQSVPTLSAYMTIALAALIGTAGIVTNRRRSIKNPV